jgi:O-phosphoseryl-tRNA(Cys) synthetase
MKKIIIAQVHDANLAGIKALMCEQLPEMVEHTSFCNNIADALRAVGDTETIIITGRVFKTDTCGMRLAVQAKEKNPNTKVLMYSVMPIEHPSIDGFIEKLDGTCHSGQHRNVIEFLRSKH